MEVCSCAYIKYVKSDFYFKGNSVSCVKKGLEEIGQAWSQRAWLGVYDNARWQKINIGESWGESPVLESVFHFVFTMI